MPLQLNLDEKDKVKVIFKTLGGGNRNEDFEVIEETDSLIKLKNSRGAKTIDKYDIISRKVKVEKIEKHKESEDTEMAKVEPKITKEQLQKECKIHGTGGKAETIIGEKYGLSQLTIRTYIGKWFTDEEKANFRKVNNSNIPKNEVKKDFVPENKVPKKDTGNALEYIKIQNNNLSPKLIVLEGKNGKYNLSSEGMEFAIGNISRSFKSKEEFQEFLGEFNEAFDTWEKVIKGI